MFTTSDLFGRFHSPRDPRRHAQIQAAAPHELEQLFGSQLPPGLLSATEEGPNSRKRVYSVSVTFWTFLWQCLHPGSACRHAVRHVIAWFALMGWGKVEEDDSPYCKARRRLDKATLQRALHASAASADQRARDQWRFHGREVVVGDGTTSLAADTRANQRKFPQSKNQKPGCGFPLVRWVALFSLASGALRDVALGNKHQSELKLFRKLWEGIRAGMIFLADRGFCDFATVAGLLLQQVDSVLRLNAGRCHDLRRGRRLGRWDRLVTWHKPPRKPRTVSKKLWNRLPAQLTLRLLSYPVQIPGFRPHRIYLATTLLDPKLYPVQELAELYLRRWRVELFLRDIKTTMKLEFLRCKSPTMVWRELHMHLIAYNLIRGLMVEAASIHDVDIQRISFKGSVDTVREFSPVIARARSRRQRIELTNSLLEAIAGDPLPERPDRIEPRNQKRRPKDFPFLVEPRATLRARLLGTKKPKK